MEHVSAVLYTTAPVTCEHTGEVLPAGTRCTVRVLSRWEHPPQPGLVAVTVPDGEWNVPLNILRETPPDRAQLELFRGTTP